MSRISWLIGLVAYASTAAGQAAPTVPSNDQVYAFLDELKGAGILDVGLLSQRPLSRNEIGRLLANARRRLPAQSADSTTLSRSLVRYCLEFPVAIERGGLPRARYAIETIAANSPSRGIAPDANGTIDVRVNPLLSNRLGVTAVDGSTLNLSTTLESTPTSWLAVGATARLGAVSPRGDRSSSAGFLDQAYARGLFRNVAVTLGRDYVFLGQGEAAGITNSMDTRGLDLIRISSDHPFVLPSVLRYLGPLQATAYLADLGAHRDFPHSHLLGYRLAGRILPGFELGATVIDEVGGQGAPGGTLLQKLEDAFPPIDALFLHRRTFFSDKYVGVDARWRVPGPRGIQLYMESMYDDADWRRLRSTLTEDGAYVWGISAACLAACGTVRVSSEYHATGLRFYTHGAFSSGYTLDGNFIGDQLGPRGKGLYTTIDFNRVDDQLSVSFAHEIRSGDKYGSVSTTADDSDFHFVLYEHNPAERRWRSVVTQTIGTHRAVSIHASLGVERVEHFGFVAGGWRTNGLADVRVDVRSSRK